MFLMGWGFFLHLSYTQGVTWGNAPPRPQPPSLIYTAGGLEFQDPEYHALNGVRLGIQILRLVGKGCIQVGAGLVLN